MSLAECHDLFQGDNTFYVEFEKPPPGPEPDYSVMDDPWIPPRIPECSTPFRAFFMKVVCLV